ncbi:hypothetical protein OF83DRAFT_1072890, partial [Amylostereum chailletii]
MIKGGVGAAVVLYRQGQRRGTRRKYLGRATEHTVYEAELVGIVLAVAALREEKATGTITIALDNEATIRATQDDEAKSDSYLLDAIHQAIKTWEEESTEPIQVVIRWIPGHEGAEGNEAADIEAKRAA